jgi:hypothetical protein
MGRLSVRQSRCSRCQVGATPGICRPTRLRPSQSPLLLCGIAPSLSWLSRSLWPYRGGELPLRRSQRVSTPPAREAKVSLVVQALPQRGIRRGLPPRPPVVSVALTSEALWACTATPAYRHPSPLGARRVLWCPPPPHCAPTWLTRDRFFATGTAGG